MEEGGHMCGEPRQTVVRALAIHTSMCTEDRRKQQEVVFECIAKHDV